VSDDDLKVGIGLELVAVVGVPVSPFYSDMFWDELGAVVEGDKFGGVGGLEFDVEESAGFVGIGAFASGDDFASMLLGDCSDGMTLRERKWL